MESRTYLDTHVVAWVYGGYLRKLPAAVRRSLECDTLIISPMVKLELQYLHEIGRASEPGAAVIDALAASVGLLICDLPFADVVATALELRWTRDPFDRIIVAQAMLQGAPLVTRDRCILENYARAFWDD